MPSGWWAVCTCTRSWESNKTGTWHAVHTLFPSSPSRAYFSWWWYTRFLGIAQHDLRLCCRRRDAARSWCQFQFITDLLQELLFNDICCCSSIHHEIGDWRNGLWAADRKIVYFLLSVYIYCIVCRGNMAQWFNVGPFCPVFKIGN